MLCDHLEGWDREGGREGDARGKRYRDISGNNISLVTVKWKPDIDLKIISWRKQRYFLFVTLLSTLYFKSIYFKLVKSAGNCLEFLARYPRSPNGFLNL